MIFIEDYLLEETLPKNQVRIAKNDVLVLRKNIVEYFEISENNRTFNVGKDADDNLYLSLAVEGNGKMEVKASKNSEISYKICMTRLMKMLNIKKKKYLWEPIEAQNTKAIKLTPL